MGSDAAQPLRETTIPETTIVVRMRASDPPEGHVMAAQQELAFTGWVELVNLLNQLAYPGEP